MMHYFIDQQPENIKKCINNKTLTGPEFIGQGCTERVGSDTYGYYVAEILKPNKIVALIAADAEYIKSWYDGSMECSLPTDKLLKYNIANPNKLNKNFYYIMRYGKNWYWCDIDIINSKIIRRHGAHATLSWNGAFSYRDPSF
jgi:hypothetical protein